VDEGERQVQAAAHAAAVRLHPSIDRRPQVDELGQLLDPAASHGSRKGEEAGLELKQFAAGLDRVERTGKELRLIVSDGPAAIPNAANALAGIAGVTIREMALRRPTLDDVFLDVTGLRFAGDAGDDDPDDDLSRGANTPASPPGGAR